VDQAEPENQVVSRYQPEHRINANLGSHECYYLLLSYIKFQPKYRYSLQELTRMIASVVMEQRLLIDILSLNEQSLKRVRDPAPQLALF